MRKSHEFLKISRYYVEHKNLLLFNGVQCLRVKELKILDYMLCLAGDSLLSEDKDEIFLSAGAYLKFRGLKKPSKKAYEDFYKVIGLLRYTEICWGKIRAEKNEYEQGRVFIFDSIREVFAHDRTTKGFIMSINLRIIHELKNISNFIKQDLAISDQLNKKYSYLLYCDFVRRNLLRLPQCNYKITDLKNMLRVGEYEERKAFNRFLKNALDEIREKANLDIEYYYDREIISFINKPIKIALDKKRNNEKKTQNQVNAIIEGEKQNIFKR